MLPSKGISSCFRTVLCAPSAPIIQAARTFSWPFGVASVAVTPVPSCANDASFTSRSTFTSCDASFLARIASVSACATQSRNG